MEAEQAVQGALEVGGVNHARWGRRALWYALFLGCALRLANAWNTSFWLDDFHSLYHARAADMGTLLRGLLLDNHPPLSFLLLRLGDGSLGANEWGLHLPNLLIAAATALLLWRLGHKLGLGKPLSRWASIGAIGFLACSPMHVDLSSNLRMYALLGLCVLGLLGALIDQFERGKGCLATLLWLLLGLHTHYHFLHASLLLGIISMGLVIGARVYRPRMRGLLLAYGSAFCLALPWYLTGFREQLAHGLAPGGSAVSLTQLGMGFLHLLHQGVGETGALLRALLLAGGGLALLLALAGQLHLLGRAKSAARPAGAILVAATAFLLPLWSAAAAAISARAGFESRYLVGALAPMALLAGLGAFEPLVGPARLRRARALAGGYSLSCAILLSIFLAASSGYEDYRSATKRLLSEAQDGDGVLPADWQPACFPHGIGWNYYSEQLGSPESARLVRLEHDQNFSLLHPEQLGQLKRVHCLLRSIPGEAPLLRKLRSFYAKERTQSFGRGIYLLSFSQPKTP